MKMICPHCGLKGTAGEVLLGKKVRCPECQQVFRVNEDVAMIIPPEPEVSGVVEEAIENVEAKKQKVEEQEQTLELPGEDIGDDEIILEEEVAKIDLAYGVKVCSKCGFALSETFLQEIDGNVVCGLCAA